MFMGCKDGEIEVGTMSSNTNVRMGGGIRNMLLGGEFAPLSPHLGEFIYHDRSSWPSPSYSSSSLHRSLSVGSPEYSSLIPSNATSAAGGGHCVPGAGCLRETSVEQEVMGQPRSSRPQQQQPVPPHHQVITTHAYAHGPARLAGQFHAPTSDVDAAMARAMLVVISSSDQAPGQAARPCGAFEPYVDGASTPAPKTEAAAQVFRGQGMIKRALSILREIRALPPEGTSRHLISSNVQTNHVMSERKRREKLNESFEALRASLPPETKRDKASVLASAMDLVNSLKAEISELEGKNRSMEARLQLPQRPDGTGDEERLAADHDDDPGEMVRVKIDKDVVVPRGTSSSAAGILQQIVQLRVAAPVEFCDMIDLVLRILECLKTMRGIKLVSLEAGVPARQMNPIRRAILTIQIKGVRAQVGDWDEGSFERSIARAVLEATSSRRPETAAP